MRGPPSTSEGRSSFLQGGWTGLEERLVPNPAAQEKVSGLGLRPTPVGAFVTEDLGGPFRDPQIFDLSSPP